MAQSLLGQVLLQVTSCIPTPMFALKPCGVPSERTARSCGCEAPSNVNPEDQEHGVSKHLASAQEGRTACERKCFSLSGYKLFKLQPGQQHQL